MVRLIAVLIALLAFPAIVSAQAASSMTFTQHPAATPNGSASTTYTAPAAAYQCNQVPNTVVPPTPNLNPRVIYWDDPVNAGRQCKFDTTTASPIFAWPSTGSYVMKAFANLIVDGVTIPSVPSDPTAPFVRATPLGQPVGLKVGS